ncbi:MAG: transglutaminase domain-containing protein [Gaiellaceae bacterium]
MGAPRTRDTADLETDADTRAAVTQIRREIDYIEATVLRTAGRAYPRGYLEALATMSYVVGHVSAPAYGYMASRDEPLPGFLGPPLVESTLSKGAGVCGHASQTMLALLAHLGVRGRLSLIYFSTPTAAQNSHAAVEVFYNSRWHLFDPTWGRFYRRPKSKPWQILSAHAVLAMSPEERAVSAVYHQTLLWTQVVSQSRSVSVETGFAVFDLPHVRLDVDGKTVYSR